jgi:hypothetical protein
MHGLLNVKYSSKYLINVSQFLIRYRNITSINSKNATARSVHWFMDDTFRRLAYQFLQRCTYSYTFYFSSSVVTSPENTYFIKILS